MLRPHCLAQHMLAAHPSNRLHFSAPPDGDIPYTVHGWDGQEVASGVMERIGENNVRTEPLPSEPGHYDIVTESRTFGVSVVPNVYGPSLTPACDPFFAADTAYMDFGDRSADMLDYATLLSRTGITMGRERFAWKHFDMDGDGESVRPPRGDRMTALLDAYSRAGLTCLVLSMHPPEMYGKPPFPHECEAAARSYRGLAECLSGFIGRPDRPGIAHEVWNEPAHKGIDADRYTAWLAALDAQWDRAWGPLVGGVHAGVTTIAELDAYYQAGHAMHCDVVSAHLHTNLIQLASDRKVRGSERMVEFVTRHRDHMDRHGKPGQPLWLTESGCEQVWDGDRPTPESERQSAVEIALKAVEAKACGVARYFAYLASPFKPSSLWSHMLDPFGVPLRPLTAYATVIRKLQHYRHCGDLTGTGATRARVFYRRAVPGSVAVLCGDGDADLSRLAVTGVWLTDGRAYTGAADVVPLSGECVYVGLDADPKRLLKIKRLNVDTDAMGLLRRAGL